MNYRIVNILPSTFFSTDKDIKIFDSRKKVFYFHPNKERNITFNLPRGIFFTGNKIERKNIFVPYKKFVSPFPKDFLRQVKVEIKPNPNKATNYRLQKRFVIDPKIAFHEYAPVPVFTIAHEIGHFIHFPKRTLSTNINSSSFKKEADQCEKDADSFAVHYMLGNGYNPTQIKIAKELVLSHVERKLCLDELTTNINNNYRR